MRVRGAFEVPTALPHPVGGSESPTVCRLMVSFKNPEDPLACAIVAASAVQECLSTFSPVVIQYQGFSHIDIQSGDEYVWPKSGFHIYFVNIE